jgi:hypothetical protein
MSGEVNTYITATMRATLRNMPGSGTIVGPLFLLKQLTNSLLSDLFSVKTLRRLEKHGVLSDGSAELWHKQNSALINELSK